MLLLPISWEWETTVIPCSFALRIMVFVFSAMEAPWKVPSVRSMPTMNLSSLVSILSMKTLAVVAGTLLVNVPVKKLQNVNFASDQNIWLSCPTGDLKPQSTQWGLRILFLFHSWYFSAVSFYTDYLFEISFSEIATFSSKIYHFYLGQIWTTLEQTCVHPQVFQHLQHYFNLLLSNEFFLSMSFVTTLNSYVLPFPF